MTKPAASRPAESTAAPVVRFRLRVQHSGRIAIGPGKIDLLEAVREHGSISAAARSIGMSYRRAWLLLDELNQSLSVPATTSEQGGQSGGGSALTEVGEQLIQLYRDIESQAQRACAKDIGELVGFLADPPRPG